jgi:T-complex protein 1 subunit eta
VVILAAELLKQAKPYIEDGVHPQIIVAAYRRAAVLALERLDQIAVHISKDDPKYVLLLSFRKNARV